MPELNIKYTVTEKSTAHSLRTPYGHSTPHRHPDTAVSALALLNKLTKQLYPTGRAWQIAENSDFDNLHKGLDVSAARFGRDAKETINSTLPDNEEFDESDVNLWEYRLGLFSNTAVDLALRRASVLRKLAYPAGVQARQHPDFIENQLRLAGFDVRVHENTIPYRTPSDIAGLSGTERQHSNGVQHSDSTQGGGVNFSLIANSANPEETFSVGGVDNLWATFFIASIHIEQPANVDALRRQEFRELVLKLKPAHTVAFININYR
jgi:hypothetical protein